MRLLEFDISEGFSYDPWEVTMACVIIVCDRVRMRRSK